jgi:hypothetical protein
LLKKPNAPQRTRCGRGRASRKGPQRQSGGRNLHCTSVGCALSLHASASFPGNSHQDDSMSRFDVAFKVKNLLPCAEHKSAIPDRNRERLTKEGCLQVGMPVPVVPRLFMAIMPARRNEFIEQSWQVCFKSRLKFDCADRAGAADVEHIHETCLNF